MEVKTMLTGVLIYTGVKVGLATAAAYYYTHR